MPKKIKKDKISVEKTAEIESEAISHHSQEASVDAIEFPIDEEAEKGLIVEEGADVDQVVPAEVAAIHEIKEPVKKKSQPKEFSKKPSSSRSKKYTTAKAIIEPGKLHKIEEAIELAKKVSLSKFDGAIELHLRLVSKKTKGSTESQRGIFNLPYGSGKEKKIIILDEKKIEQIAKTKKIDFDIAISTPALMPQVAKIAKILGPKGKMPDPKSGTVTNEPEVTIKEIRSGKVEYRVDANNNVHQIIGRVSWDTAKLLENAQVVLAVFPRTRLMSVTVCPSIGPAIPVELTKN